MKHLALPIFWRYYQQLPKEVCELADKNFKLLQTNPQHPSLHFKKLRGVKPIWSVRVGKNYRALGYEKPDCIEWFWIGTHADYDNLLS